MNTSGGSTVRIQFTEDGAAIETTSTIVGVTEHLIMLELDDRAVAVPNLGAMVDLEIGRRTYRSTVQHTEAGGFTVLRPRELDDLDGRLDLATIDDL